MLTSVFSLKNSAKWVAVIMATAIGVGLMMPAPSCRPVPPSLAVTSNTAYNLKNAILAYHVEYGQYPLEGENSDLNTGDDTPLIPVLLGSADPQLIQRNTRQIVFFRGKPAQMREGRPSSGLHETNERKFGLYDYWGNPYHVLIDYDENNHVRNPEPEPKIAGPVIPETVLVWSAGPDGDFSTWEDNIKTW